MNKLATLALVFTACATSQVYVAPDQAAQLERKLVGEQRHLRVSMFVTPFFGDATRKLLTPAAPEEVRLLENPDHTPVNPGAVERTFPVGTQVRIRSVEFPSASVMAQRVLYTPRSLLWVSLEVEGVKNALPFILVMRPGLRTGDEVVTELNRLISRDDPRPSLEGFSEAVREAVKTKTAVVDMPAEALEMAWGAPESRRIELVGQQRHETWKWPGTKSATLIDGKVTELKSR